MAGEDFSATAKAPSEESPALLISRLLSAKATSGECKVPVWLTAELLSATATVFCDEVELPSWMTTGLVSATAEYGESKGEL